MKNRARKGFGLMGVGVLIVMLTVVGCQKKPASQSNNTGTPTSPGTGTVQAGKWTILDTRTDLTDRARAKQNVEDAIIKYPDVGCLVGLWSYNGPAILSAVKDAKQAGKIFIVCFDEEEDTLQGVKDGYIHATVVQQPYEFGYQSVRILAALARGDKSVLPENGVVDVPVQIIRKENVDEFWTTLKARVAGEDRGAVTATKGGQKVKVAFVTNNASDFWRIAKAGVQRAEVEFNATCDFQMPPGGTPDDQQRIVEALIAKKVSGMAISPNDPENQLEMLNQACEGMNVICHDSDAPKSKRLCYVGTNNYKAGREAGKLIKEVLPNGGNIVIFVGRLDAQNAKERREGIIDELSDKPEP